MPWELYNLQFATSSAQEAKERYLKRAEELRLDSGRAYRLELQLCSVCYSERGGLRVGYQEYYCKACGQKGHAACLTQLCKMCAQRFGSCYQCGADLDLRNRRKLEKKK